MKLFAATSLCLALSALSNAYSQNCVPGLTGAQTGPFVRGSSSIDAETYSSILSMLPINDPADPSLIVGGSLYFPEPSSGPTEVYRQVPAARYQQGRWSAMPAQFGVSLGLAYADFSSTGGPAASIYSLLKTDPAPAGYIHRWGGTSWVRTVAAPSFDPLSRVLLEHTDAQGPVLLAGATTIYAWRGAGEWTPYAPFTRTAGEFTRLRDIDDGSGMAVFAMGTIQDSTRNLRFLVKLVDGVWTQYDLPPAALASSQVTDIAMFDDGTSTTGPEVYVAWQNPDTSWPTITSVARKRNGTWETIAQNVPSGNVVTGAGLLVRTIQGVPHLYLAQNLSLQEWTATGWKVPLITGAAPSTQPGGVISDIAPFNDGHGDQAYFGGHFSDVLEGAPTYRHELATPGYSLFRTGDHGLTSVAQGFGYSSDSSWLNATYVFSVDLPEGPRLLVGGGIKRAGGQFAEGAAMFDGSRWFSFNHATQPLAGITSAAVATIEDQPHIVARRGLVCYHWNGVQWQLLPAQPSATNLIALNNTLYAFGTSLQRFTGSAWETVAAGPFNSAVVADLGSGPRIILGTNTGVFEFDGTNLAQVGPNSPIVRGIAVVNDAPGPRIYIYAPALTNRIARLTNGAWEELPPGVHNVNSPVPHAIASFDDGDGPALYVAGHGASSASIVPSAIARWRNNAWSVAGPVIAQGQVEQIQYPAMTVVGDRLYIAGSFSRIGNVTADHLAWIQACPRTCNADFNGDGDFSTDTDIEAFFRCLAGVCCPRCSADFNNDGDTGTDTDIESFFRVLAGGPVRSGAASSAKQWIRRSSARTKRYPGFATRTCPFLRKPSMSHFATTSSSTQARRMNVRIAAALAAIASLTAPTLAQDCGGFWLSGQAAPGLNRNGKVYTLEQLSDGSILVGGNFTLAGDVHTFNIARFDPASHHWSALGAGAPSFVLDILPLPNGDLLVGGEPDDSSFGLSRYHASTNTWTSPAVGITGLHYLTFVESLASTSTNEVIVGGWFTAAGGIPTSAIARYNPVTDSWSAFGTGLTITTANQPNISGPSFARKLMPLPGGDLIVAGNFDTADGTPATCIARLNPTTGSWSALGAGVNGYVNSLALDAQGNLIVGGAFTTAGGLPAAHVARYDFSAASWSALGSGFPGSSLIIDLVAPLPDGDIFAASRTTSGPVTIRMARYSHATQTWTTLTTGTAGLYRIHCSDTLPDGSILFGGDFELIGGVSANSIATFNPASNVWAPFTSGNGGPVSSLIGLADGGILAFGMFQSLGGAISPGAARFDPAANTWTPVVGRPSDVRSGALLANGDVILGGTFVSAGSLPANRIVRYTPGTGAFSALGSGVTGTGYTAVTAALELPDGDLIIGGTFTTAGSIPANRIARYTPSTGTWSTLGTGLNYEVQSLALTDNGDLLAGTAGGLYRFSFSASTWSTPLAAGATTRGPVTQILRLPDGRTLLATQATWSNSALAIFDPATNTYSVLATAGPSEVFSFLRVTGNQVAVGGTFRVPGYPGSRNIAKFNPTTLAWTPLQSGFNEQLLSMDVLANGDLVAGGYFTRAGDVTSPYFARYRHNTADFNNDGDTGTDADIESFFACLAGNCCPSCASADFDSDGDTGTDADIESFFRVLAGGAC